MPFYGGTRRVLLNLATRGVAPTISSISRTQLTAESFRLTWTTNVPSTSQVAYGTSSPPTSLTTLDSTLVTSHSVTVTGLTEMQTYFYQPRSKVGTAERQGTTSSFTLAAELPTFGPMASLTRALITSVNDITTPTVSASYYTAPITGKNIAYPAYIQSDPNFQNYNIYVRANKVNLQSTAIYGYGSDGTDAQDFGGTFQSGGQGGDGWNGGGGGAASSDGSSQSGGWGGSLGTSGNNGDTGGDAAGGGLGGYGTGNDGDPYPYLYTPVDGNSGGSTFGPGAGGGGGGTFGRIVLCFNQYIGDESAALAGFGGAFGHGVGTGQDGDQGEWGVGAFWFRTYDGSIASSFINLETIELWEVQGTPDTGFSYVQHTDLSDTWNHGNF